MLLVQAQGVVWDCAAAHLTAHLLGSAPQHFNCVPFASLAAGSHVQWMAQEGLDVMAAAHRPHQTPSSVDMNDSLSRAILAACLASTCSPHGRAAECTSFQQNASQLPAASPSPDGHGPGLLPRLPALSTLLFSGSVAAQYEKPVTTSALAVPTRKKYRDRFSLEEEEALIAFWFKHRFKYSVKSKILWRLAERNGVTLRDPISVQKHMDHMLKHGRMRELFRAFRRKGKLGDIIDSIDVERDFASPSKVEGAGPSPSPASGCEDAASDAETAVAH